MLSLICMVLRCGGLEMSLFSTFFRMINNIYAMFTWRTVCFFMMVFLLRKVLGNVDIIMGYNFLVLMVM